MKDPNPPRATEPKVGATLWTKDGSSIGNAIIREVRDYGVWPHVLIETDFGNRVKLTVEELESMFTYGFQSDVGEWEQDRDDLRKHGKGGSQ